LGYRGLNATVSNDLIEKYNMPNPFNRDTIKDIVVKLENELNVKRLVST